MTTATQETMIEADDQLPAIKITRDFAATAAQIVRAHTDPELFVQWIGCGVSPARVIEWDARDGGSWRYVATTDGEDYEFRGCFHTVRDDRLVQTFTFMGFPDSVSLETMTFEDLGDGRTRMHAVSLFDSYQARDGMLSSGMGDGVNSGHAKLDALIADGTVA